MLSLLLEILAVAIIALLVARRASPPWRGRLLNVLKAYVTVRAFWLLLTHPVALEDGARVVAWRLILEQLQGIEAATFWLFVLLAGGIKFVGILSSMYRWTLLLRGQGIDLPFRHIFGSFLIGRFIGTFLPSTAGLDGYKLYDAARFSGRSVEATAATALEKVLGVSGIFLSFLVALPFGIQIFGERAGTIAGITVPIAVGVIGGLLVLLWHPALIQWGLVHLPLPGRDRLEGLVMRISHSTAAYRDKKGLVLKALVLSFVVHFTTAAMYYFTALAIGARNAHFWPIAFGSSIQIFATVVSPFTIAGEGIREAAQLVVLGAWIGPAAAIVSAALGFWAAEAPTLLGGLFWWLRSSAYQPAYCRVDGVQVDYEEAARAALELGAPLERGEGRRRDEPAPLAQRLRSGASLGLGAGLLSGLAIGVVEAAVIVADGVGAEAQVLGYGPLAYAVVLGVSGAGLGGLLSLLPLEDREIRGWTPSLAMLALALPLALAITLFRVRRDLFHEQMPSWPVLGLILAAAAAVAVGLFVLGPRLFNTRFGRLFRALPALALVALVTIAGGGAARLLGPSAPLRAAAAAIPETLAERPNLLLIMVDTLRADALACYGGPVAAPAMCSLAQQQGSAFEGFSHASWTKPATATLLSSLLPSSHGATSKTAVLPSEVELVSEVLKKQGYVTGGIVSNINLAKSFGFDQGYDEYHYLGPDYLMGAEESSSKLILYQIVRKLWFTLHPGHRVSDFYQDAATVNGVAFDWLERHRETRFFLFLHYMDPHDPYFAHPYDGNAVARVENENPDPQRAQAIRRLYEGEIEWLDRHVAELLEKLRDLGLYDDTLIVLTSDHGEEFHEHGGWWHGTTLYEEQIYVPLLVKWARSAGAPSGRVRNRLARLIDVAPTLIAQAGAPAPDPMQGIDLSLDPNERTARDHLLFAEEDHEGNVLEALRTADWKLIQANPGNPRGLAPVELFAIADDPGEHQDLLDRHPEVAKHLLEQVETERRVAERLAVESGETARLTREECEKLRVLGYVSDCDHLN